jgi:hypothetical protein
MTMKIEATVKGVTREGDELVLLLDGWPVTAPDGTLARTYAIEVPANEKAKRAFYIGRRVNITVEPQ